MAVSNSFLDLMKLSRESSPELKDAPLSSLKDFIEYIQELEDPIELEKIQKYGKLLSETSLDWNNSESNTLAFETVIEMSKAQTFCNLVRAATTRFGDFAQKQHWLPYLYISRFTSKGRRNRKNFTIPTVYYEHDKKTPFLKSEGDNRFIHGLSQNKRGAYRSSTENFFGRSEYNFGLTMNNIEVNSLEPTQTDLALAISFIVSIYVRNIHSIDYSDISELYSAADAIEKLYDELPSTLTAKIVNSGSALPFIPEKLVSLLKSSDGNYSYVVALSSRRALVLSSRVVSLQESKRIVERWRSNLLSQARMKSWTVYGLNFTNSSIEAREHRS